MFERQEDAHIPARRIERANEGDKQQRPEGVEPGEAQPCAGHEQRGGKQAALEVHAMGDKAERQGQQGRTQQRAGRDQPNADRTEAEPRQVDREQDSDKPVAEGAYPACDHDARETVPSESPSLCGTALGAWSYRITLA